MPLITVPSGEPLLQTKQVAALLKIKPCTVYELVRNGTLPAIRVGARMVRFRRSSIEEWLTEREMGGREAS